MKRITFASHMSASEPHVEAHWLGNPCANNLRPGRSAYVRALDGGADFHIIAVHSDSGTSPRDFDHRQTALRRPDDLFAALGQDVPDADVIVLGDFNTMGAEGRTGPVEETALAPARATRPCSCAPARGRARPGVCQP